MNSPKPELPEISEEDRTPLLGVLLELLAWQQKRIDELERIIVKLKGATVNQLPTFFHFQHLFFQSSQ